MDRHRIGIVIPALNEAKTITRIVSAARVYGIPIVVDDGSSDLTGEFAMAAGAVVFRHDTNKGYDQALNSGFIQAQKLNLDAIITIDADGQHDPTILQKYIQELAIGADIVVGVRDRRQRLAEHIFAWVGKIKWGLQDPLCGMKGYQMTLYKELGHFDSYGSIGTELAIFAANQGKKIKQLPIKTKDRLDLPRFGKRYAANMQILRALWWGLLQQRNQPLCS